MSLFENLGLGKVIRKLVGKKSRSDIAEEKADNKRDIARKKADKKRDGGLN